MAINQTHYINIIPQVTAPIVVHCSQGDTGTTVYFYVINGDEQFDCTSYSVAVHGTRQDGVAFGPVPCTVDGNKVSFNLTSDMTAVKGAVLAEVKIGTVGTANFAMLVEEGVFPLGVTYENDTSVYEDILNYVQSGLTTEATARAAADTSLNAAIDAEETARISADSTLQNNINSEASVRTAQDGLLQAQIDQLVAPSGEAPSAAEIENARIGDDAVTYDTLGNAIRTQISNTNDTIEEVLGLTDVTGEITNGYYLNLDGTEASNADYQITDYIPVNDGDIIIYDGVYGTAVNGSPTNIPVVFYNRNKTFVSNLIAPTKSSGSRWLIHEKATIPMDGYIRAESAYNNTSNPSFPKRPVLVKKYTPKNNNISIVPSDMLEGYVILTESGALSSNGNYYYKTDIPVYPNDKLYFYGGIGGNPAYHDATGIAGFDKNHQYVCSVFDNGIGGYSDDGVHYYNKFEITVPDNVYYISMCVRKDSSIAKLQFENKFREETEELIDEKLSSNMSYDTILQSEMSTGYIVQSNGVKYQNASYAYVEHIPVLPNQKIMMTAYFGGGADNSGGISGYDINGSFVKRVFDGAINGNPDDNRMQYVNKVITIPEDVYQIAFSTRVDGVPSAKLELFDFDDPITFANSTIAKHDSYNPKGTVFEAEVKSSVEAVQTILASSAKPMLTFAVFTDLHHDPKYGNDPTIDMFANIEALNDRLHFDGILNLGDTIDGQFQTQYVAEGCISDVINAMYDISAERSHSIIGNHDDNIQSTWADRGNLDASNQLTNLELYEAFNKGSFNEVHSSTRFTDYYVDYDLYDVRAIFISPYYTTWQSTTATWLANTALDTTKKVIVFAHTATKAEWGYEDDISNGSIIESALNTFVNNGGTIMAFVHGHTHGDMIETDGSIEFTEVAIGCAKFEQPTSGTQGITYQPRSADDYTKILFDLICVDQTNNKVHFIRCGAGTDREISY